MMNQNKSVNLFSYNYDKKRRKYRVQLQTPVGLFEGKAKLHLEDRKHALPYLGYEIAEARAWVRYIKVLNRMNKDKLKMLKSFKEQTEEIKTTIKELEEAIQFNKQNLESLAKEIKYACHYPMK